MLNEFESLESPVLTESCFIRKIKDKLNGIKESVLYKLWYKRQYKKEVIFNTTSRLKRELCLLWNYSEEEVEKETLYKACKALIVEIKTNNSCRELHYSQIKSMLGDGILGKIISGIPLSPLHGTGDEWVLVDEENELFQNNRDSRVFREGDTNNFYQIDVWGFRSKTNPNNCWTSQFSSRDITELPYQPREITYIDVDEDWSDADYYSSFCQDTGKFLK